MNRDFLKTLGGILIIGVIVVATFLYGNQQRQEQIRQDEEAGQEQTASEEQEATEGQPEGQPGDQQATGDQPAGGTGGGALPDTTPRTGGEVYLFAIPAAGIGAIQYLRAKRQTVTKL